MPSCHRVFQPLKGQHHAKLNETCAGQFGFGEKLFSTGPVHAFHGRINQIFQAKDIEAKLVVHEGDFFKIALQGSLQFSRGFIRIPGNKTIAAEMVGQRFQNQIIGSRTGGLTPIGGRLQNDDDAQCLFVKAYGGSLAGGIRRFKTDGDLEKIEGSPAIGLANLFKLPQQQAFLTGAQTRGRFRVRIGCRVVGRNPNRHMPVRTHEQAKLFDAFGHRAFGARRGGRGSCARQAPEG